MSFVCLSLASLLALAGSAPVTQAQPDDPVDEEIEDYVTVGVEPACPFRASSTSACIWTAGCSATQCNDKCVVDPKSSSGIDLPKIVDEKLLTTYACPTLSALVRAWTTAREGGSRRRLQEGVLPHDHDVIATLKRAVARSHSLPHIPNPEFARSKALTGIEEEIQQQGRHLSEAAPQPVGFGCPTTGQIDDSAPNLAALLEVAALIEDDGGIDGGEEPDLQDYAAPFLAVPLRHFAGPLSDPVSLKAFFEGNCATEAVSGAVVQDLYPFVSLEALTSPEGGGADGVTGGFLLDSDYDYDSSAEDAAVAPGAAHRSVLQAPPPPPPSEAALPASITVCRDTSGLAEAANEFMSSQEAVCMEDYESSWPMAWCLSVEATLRRAVVAQSAAPLVPNCLKLKAQFVGISPDDVTTLIEAYETLSEECAAQSSEDDCTAASSSGELEALKSAWQAVGSAAPAIPDAATGISSPANTDGEAATVSSDTSSEASEAKLAAEAANDTGLEEPVSRSTGSGGDDSAAYLGVSGLLSAALSVLVFAALFM